MKGDGIAPKAALRRSACFGVCVVLGWIGATGPAPGGDIPNGLVAHWAFNEMTGAQVRDSSTNRLDGVLTGGVWTNGVAAYDGAVQLDGKSQAVWVPGPGQPVPWRIAGLVFGSISIRVRFPETGSGEVIPLFYFGEAHEAMTNNSLIIEIGHANDPGDRRLYFTILNRWFCFDSGTNLMPNTWHHFVGVVGMYGNTGYLDGQEMLRRHYNLGSDASYDDFFSSVPVRDCLAMGYGRYGAEAHLHYGPEAISDVQIYSRPLASNEVAQLYRDRQDAGLFKVESIASPVGDQGLVLTWRSDANYRYSVFGTDGAYTPRWQAVSNAVNIPATPPLNSFFIPLPNSASGFYRVQAIWVPGAGL